MNKVKPPPTISCCCRNLKSTKTFGGGGGGKSAGGGDCKQHGAKVLRIVPQVRPRPVNTVERKYLIKYVHLCKQQYVPMLHGINQ